ncbi:hypothetical protein GCM10010191_54060 [Actinomadura vinacea]|uniref:Histidine kinase/HSP90-like ATPase domain-containing protein n=1 Tax=Actinomadura vinacea TaxID=115336 RepID=A0ABP5WPY1_9ACTN
MDALDAWTGSPAFVSGPFVEPSLELGTPADWSAGPSAEGLLGEIDIASTPAAVRLARSYVRELAGDFFGARTAALDDLELLASEAVTNAVLHAAPLRDGTVLVAALHADRRVRVEVTDGGPRPDRPGPTGDPLAPRGRGMRLIEALALEHGRQHNPDGTATFWFEMAVDDDRPGYGGLGPEHGPPPGAGGGPGARFADPAGERWFDGLEAP